MPEARDLAVVILAAGEGRRFGGLAKALLPTSVAGSDKRSSTQITFLSKIVRTARTAGVLNAIVVVGPPHAEAVRAHAQQLGCRIAHNDAPERGMASSVAVGFAALDPAVTRAAFLWPVDHPEVSVSTLRTLVDALGTHAAVRPVFEGRGGHPPLITADVWPALCAGVDVDGGARTVLAQAGVIDVEVDDRGVVRDIDTPADLEAE